MISVFSFPSYRRFLAEYLKEQKTFNAAFNAERLAKKLGIGASALKMILSGKRNLTVHHIHSFAEGMGLSAQEHDYFEALVLHEQSESAAEKRYYKKRLGSAQGRGAKATRVNLQDMLKEWYIPAVLIHLVDSKQAPDPTAIAAKLRIPEARVRETIVSLQRAGILEVHRGESVHFVMDKFAPHFSKQIYLKKLLPVVQTRIESEFHSDRSYFETHTISFTDAQFRAFLEDYKALLERTMALEGGGESAVYQLFMTAFPVL